jgi:membrane dipeptidase
VSFSSDLCEGSYASAEEWEKEFGPNGMYPSLTGILGDWWTFDGQFPKGYESLAKTTHIWDGLLARGFSEDDVEKIMGKNIMRVFYEVWGE